MSRFDTFEYIWNEIQAIANDKNAIVSHGKKIDFMQDEIFSISLHSGPIHAKK